MSDRVYNLTLEMKSDWRIGSGTGRQGIIDGFVARDSSGLPYVPSTTLRGMWRDAAERLAYGLDAGNPIGPWSVVVTHLFGDQPALGGAGVTPGGPVPALLLVSDAQYPEELRANLHGKRFARAAFCFVKSGVAIDSTNGRAKDDFLKFDEIARSGAELGATATLQPSDDATFDTAAAEFALAALRLLDRIGGDRRRGAGRCKVSVAPAPGLTRDPVAAAVEKLGKLAAPTIAPARKLPQAFTFSDNVGAAQGFARLKLSLTLEAPATIAAKVEGNVTGTHDHVPGTMLIGAAKAFALKAGVAADAFFPALAAGRIRVLTAYPGYDGARGLPAPVVIEEKKDDVSGPLPPGGKKRRGNLSLRGNGDGQRKPLRADYCLPELAAGGGLRFVKKPDRALRTHNVVDDQRQKPTAETAGGVYVSEVLEAGTQLHSQLAIDSALLKGGKIDAGTAWDDVKIRLGRAKSAGFGAATVRASMIAAETAAKPAATGLRRLLVAGDLVLPARADESPVEAVRQMLGDCGIKADLDVKNSDFRFKRIDGWIAAWGLPRPTLTAIAAGSVIAIKRVDTDAAALDALAGSGLGLRRGEGYGEIIVEPAILAEGADLNGQGDAVVETGDTARRTAPGKFSAGLNDHLVAIERAALLDVVRTFAELAAADKAAREEELKWNSESGRPNSSQLGNLRALFDATAANPDFKNAIAVLEKVKGVERRAKEWSADNGGTVIGLLVKLLGGQDETIWRVLEKQAGFKAAFGQALIISTAEAAMKEMKAKATSEFIVAAMRWHKRAMEKSRSAGGN